MGVIGGGRTEAIMREIASLRAQRDELDSRIRFFESQLRVGGAAPAATLPPSLSTKLDAMGWHAAAAQGGGGLSPDMVRRYSRHLLLPDFGVQGQRRLSQSSVLVVGAGGLGSAVALYLAACGVGSLGIVDGDDVELGDLHHQVIHVEAYVGQPKPLVSGSTSGLEGQLTVYNHNGSPCYRCHFPNPTACQSSSTNCTLGVVPGVIGSLQALETIKVATRVGEPLCGRMLLFDALSSRFKTVNKIHQRSSTCTVCGENSNLTQDTFVMFDYDSFAQSTNRRQSRTRSRRTPGSPACIEYKGVLDSGRAHLLLDVRPVHHFQIASIANSVNIPLDELQERLPRLRDALSEVADVSHGNHRPLYFVCQCGDDSLAAVGILRENGFPYASAIAGGP
ncbi:unnamed protein product [Miscanthus lutarioriparius]|uniref:Rhodanese domain-containing protein n=1 Tax=Miscanthus lutarioriparius TaxID=422564 RepID=A0A811QXF9_9POAL|nr:unnamed protein product [Miscanthus lutarioriparius]